MPRAPIAAAAGAACLAVLIVVSCSQQETKRALARAGPQVCSRNATPSNFASQVGAATNGQTICLGAGDYGTWTGTDKAITIRPQTGVSPTLCFDFYSTAANFTVEGGHINYDSNSPGINADPSCTNWFEVGSKNITVENMAFGNCGWFCIDDRSEGPGIVIKGNIFHDMVYPNQSPGAIRVYKSGTDPSSTIVGYNLFRDMGADGIDPGAGMTMIGNDFSNVSSQNQPQDPRHTDAIQFGNNDIIAGNFVHNGCGQGIGGFDGTSNNVIADNVIVGCQVHSLVLAGDTPGSTVDHNTVVGSGRSLIECGSKAGQGPSMTKIFDNISQIGIDSGGVPCQPSKNTHNMFYARASTSAFGGAANFDGTPQFAGGANPKTYAGYALAAGSPGKNAAGDGQDVGARVNLYPRP